MLVIIKNSQKNNKRDRNNGSERKKADPLQAKIFNEY